MRKSYAPSYRQYNRNLRPVRSQRRSRPQDVLLSLLEADSKKRIFFLLFLCLCIVSAVISRLFYLQVVKGVEFSEAVLEQQYGKIVIPAKRGEILLYDEKSQSYSKLATNTSLNLVYIDPQEIPDKEKIAQELAPLLFDEEDFLACKADYRVCPQGGVQFQEEDILVLENEETEEITEARVIKDTRTKAQLVDAYRQEILRKISQEEINYVPLEYGASAEKIADITLLGISGLYGNSTTNVIYLNPLEVNQLRISEFAQTLLPYFSYEKETLEKLLTRRKTRYVPLKRKLAPEVSDAILDLKQKSYEFFAEDRINNPYYYKGVVLLPEHWRYYPEKTLASTVLGFTDHDNEGRYGIEGRFNQELKGKSGEMFTQNDVKGSQLIFDAEKITEAVDGESFVLTLQKPIQLKVNEVLKRSVEEFHADSGSILVADPFTGNILAMANYPNFDPNNFGSVYEIRPAGEAEFDYSELQTGVYPTQTVFIKNADGNYEQVTYGWIQEERRAYEEARKRQLAGEKGVILPPLTQKYVYKNRVGLRAYVNRTVQEMYEPGSVFKSMVIASGIDSGEVTPFETYEEYKPLKIDTGTGQFQFIRNALNKYRGIQTVTQALEQSSNLGLAYVARKMGKQVFYSYLENFGFGELTYIDLAEEQRGRMSFWKTWPEAQLITTSFGQGISVTPLQMVSALSALANGGVLMQPKIISERILPTGERKKESPRVIRRVISEDTSAQMTAMLVSSIANGVAWGGGVKGYALAGKTGTAQIACTDATRCEKGKYETGTGSTVTSFGGYGPASHPRFVILVNFERPRYSRHGLDDTWGSTTSAPVFREIAEFILSYYDIPPEK